jgi:hypothetical protein
MLLRAAAKETRLEPEHGRHRADVARRLHHPQRFLGKIKEAFDKNPKLTNLLLDDFFQRAEQVSGELAQGAAAARHRSGVPTPAFSTALAFYDGYRTARLPANLLQAQRDFFGAHTYERVDKPRGEFFHTNWTGHGGPTFLNLNSQRGVLALDIHPAQTTLAVTDLGGKIIVQNVIALPVGSSQGDWRDCGGNQKDDCSAQ